MPFTKPKLDVSRVLEVEDLVKATLTAILRENRMMGSSQAALGFSVRVSPSPGGILLGLDLVNVVN